MTADSTTELQTKRIPIKKGLLTSPLAPLENVRLVGSRCLDCQEVSFGEFSNCPNCAGGNLKVIPLSQKGYLWTYTVIRNRPPGDYKGPDDPYVPLCEGLVELPEGIRVLSPIACDLDKVQIGMPLNLDVYKLYQDNDGNDVIAFRFVPATEGY